MILWSNLAVALGFTFLTILLLFLFIVHSVIFLVDLLWLWNLAKYHILSIVEGLFLLYLPHRLFYQWRLLLLLFLILNLFLLLILLLFLILNLLLNLLLILRLLFMVVLMRNVWHKSIDYLYFEIILIADLLLFHGVSSQDGHIIIHTIIWACKPFDQILALIDLLVNIIWQLLKIGIRKNLLILCLKLHLFLSWLLLYTDKITTMNFSLDNTLIVILVRQGQIIWLATHRF